MCSVSRNNGYAIHFANSHSSEHLLWIRNKFVKNIHTHTHTHTHKLSGESEVELETLEK